jgi:hypothetical protein
MKKPLQVAMVVVTSHKPEVKTNYLLLEKHTVETKMAPAPQHCQSSRTLLGGEAITLQWTAMKVTETEMASQALLSFLL